MLAITHDVLLNFCKVLGIDLKNTAEIRITVSYYAI